MEERLKQRLVGAVVLVSLAVVFVPILFDLPPGENEATFTAPIPEVPERPQSEYGPPVTITLDAPRTPRLDAELEREGAHERGASNDDGAVASPAVSGASSGAVVAGTASTGTGAAESSAGAVASEPAPPDPAPADSSPARPDPASAAGGSDGGSRNKQAGGAPAGGGWMVQLGSFAKSENARALRKRLQARGYPAFVESGSSAGDALSRVFVGPVPDRKQAQDSAAKLRREMGLEGIVMPYPGG